MAILLLLIGILVSLIGLFLIGFSIPIHEFSFGNTLMLCGATAVTGGLVIVALAAVVSEVRKLGQRLEQAPRVRPTAAEVAAAVRKPPVGRIPAPPKPATTSPQRPPRSPQLRAELPPAAQVPPPGERGTERPRPDILAVARAAAELTTSAEAEPAPVTAPTPEPAARSVEAPAGRDFGRPTGPSPEGPEKPAARKVFDSVWPSDAVPALETNAAERPAHPAAARPPESAAHPATILKSGVVDGMAYTLYTDGSIEAQLPHGIVRFASIDELRAHLERQG